MLKNLVIVGTVAIATMATIPFVDQICFPKTAVAQTISKKPGFQLRLNAEKKILTQDQEGKQKFIWTSLQGKAVVLPGDILRYTLIGENRSDHQIKNVVLNPPIPQNTAYILKSMNVSNPAQITYSIDGGKTFVQNPTVQVTTNGQVTTQAAPASAYTNIRLKIAVVPANAVIKATYETKVR
jgi:uncharacterized repeat protein (TIGR01451 family)